MDDRSISWMISGGNRTIETQDQRHQRRHRAALAAQARERDAQPWGRRAAGWRAWLATSLGRFDSASASRTPDCCPA